MNEAPQEEKFNGSTAIIVVAAQLRPERAGGGDLRGGRLQPRPAVATYDTRTLQRKPSQQPLARKDRPPLLQSEIAAIHEHLDALEARSRAVDEGVHARLEVHSGELASVTQRTDAIEQIQRQAATQAATQAEAVASMATDLQVLASHAEGDGRRARAGGVGAARGLRRQGRAGCASHRGQRTKGCRGA